LKNKESIVRARNLRKKSTEVEQLLWKRLRNRKMAGHKFLRQFPIQVSQINRNEFYIADFCCWELRLIIELDGEIHDNHKEDDELRDKVLLSNQYTVLRFNNEEIVNKLDDVVNRIKLYLN
jgi:very-short-patch-repair endonuclease